MKEYLGTAVTGGPYSPHEIGLKFQLTLLITGFNNVPYAVQAILPEASSTGRQSEFRPSLPMKLQHERVDKRMLPELISTQAGLEQLVRNP